MAFWDRWRPARRIKFFRVAVLAWVLLWFTGWMVLKVATTDRAETVAQRVVQYGQVAEIVVEIRSMRAPRGDLSRLEPWDAMDLLIYDMGLDDHLEALNPVQAGSSGEGVQVALSGLGLRQLTDLLAQVDERAGLKTVSFMLDRSFGDAVAADVNLILAR